MPLICDFILQNIPFINICFAFWELVKTYSLTVLVALDVDQARNANVFVGGQLFQDLLVHLEHNEVLTTKLGLSKICLV
jgi:hypothetical protein